MVNISTSYIKRNGELSTSPHLSGEKVLPHHIIVNKKCNNRALNSEACNTFYMGKYDHRNVSGKFRLNLRTNKYQNKNKSLGKTGDQRARRSFLCS